MMLSLPVYGQPTSTLSLPNVFAKRWLVFVCKATIGLVAAYDIYLTIKYVDSLPTMELNPIGRWLMNLQGYEPCDLEQIAGFIAAKVIGTLIAVFVIEILWHWKPTMAGVVGGSVASVQIVLLSYLTYGSPF